MYVTDKGYTVDHDIPAASVDFEAAAVDYQIIRDIQHAGPAAWRCIDSAVNRPQDIPSAASLAAAVGDKKTKHLIIGGRHPEVFRTLTAPHEDLERRGYDVVMVRKCHPDGSIRRVYRRYASDADAPCQYLINISSQSNTSSHRYSLYSRCCLNRAWPA